jgi:hypothetical protein
LIEEIDHIDVQPFQRALRNLLDVFRPAVYPDPCALTGRVEIEPELRGDHHLVTERSQSPANELLVHKRPTYFRRVEERHAAFDR